MLNFVREEIYDFQRKMIHGNLPRLEEAVSGLLKKTNYTDFIKHDLSLPPYTIYQIDFELFKCIYVNLSPWGKANQAEDIAARLFRVSSFIN